MNKVSHDSESTVRWYRKPEIIIPIVIGLISIPWWPYLFNSLANNKSTSVETTNSLDRKYSIQKKVIDGNSEINLYNMVCGSKKYKIYEAKGEFCVIDVMIVNRGSATDNAWPSDWKLYSGDREFKVTSNEGKAFEDILPSSSGTGTVAFDITINSVPNSIVVYGPCCTNGVKVEF